MAIDTERINKTITELVKSNLPFSYKILNIMFFKMSLLMADSLLWCVILLFPFKVLGILTSLLDLYMFPKLISSFFMKRGELMK